MILVILLMKFSNQNIWKYFFKVNSNNIFRKMQQESFSLPSSPKTYGLVL